MGERSEGVKFDFGVKGKPCVEGVNKSWSVSIRFEDESGNDSGMRANMGASESLKRALQNKDLEACEGIDPKEILRQLDQ